VRCSQSTTIVEVLVGGAGLAGELVEFLRRAYLARGDQGGRRTPVSCHAVEASQGFQPQPSPAQIARVDRRPLARRQADIAAQMVR
jgi:hypothetical protein